MAKENVTFEYEVRDKASANLRDIEKGIKRNRKQWNALEGDTSSYSASAGKATKSTSGLIGTIGRFAGPLAAAAGGFAAINAGIQKTIQLNQKLAEHQAIQGDLLQSIKNTGLSAEEAEKQFESLQDRITDASEDIGASIPELSAAMRELTTRTGDASVASENLNRVLALSNQSGKEYTEVAKSLGQALTQDFGPMKELGILTDAQIEKFKGMTDKGKATSEMLEILDRKTKGFAKGLPESAKNADRLNASLERLEVAFADLIGADEIVGTLATGIEKTTGFVEDFQEGWENAAPSIKAAMEELDTKTKDLTDSTEDLVKAGRWSPEQHKQRLIQLAEQNAATKRYLAEQEKARRGFSVETQEWFKATMEQINREEKAALQRINNRYGISQEELDNRQQQLALKRQELAIEKAATDRARLKAKWQKTETELMLDYQKKLEEADSQKERTLAKDEYDVELAIAKKRHQKELNALREKAAKQAQESGPSDADIQAEIERKKANIRYEAQKEYERKMAEYRHKKRQEQHNKETEEMKARYDREIELIERNHQRQQEALQKRQQDTLDLINARKEAVSSGFDIGGFTTEGADLIGLYNERLAEQVSLFGDLSSEMGTVAGAIDTAFNKQWDFANAVETTTGAFDALGSAGGAAAGILGDTVAEQAGIKAAFEAAAGTAALATGLMFPDPRYFVSAGKHFAAAGMFGAIAGTAPDTPAGAGASTGGGGGGGGASASSTPSIDRGAMIAAQKQAYLEALREVRNESRAQTIIYDNSENYNLNDHPASARRARRALDQNDSLTLGGSS